MKLKNCAVLLFALVSLAFGSSFALALPDLTIVNVLKDPVAVCNGQYQIIVFNASNIGNMPVVNGIVGFYINNVFYKSINEINLSAGQSVKKIMFIPVSSATSVMIKADPYSSIAEANENNNAYSYSVTGASCTSAATASPLKRFYKSADRDHFYTIKDSDANNALSKGYVYEKNEGKILTNYVSGTNPLVRLYSSASTSHFYTGENDIGTIQYLMSIGYDYEGTAGYVYSSQVSGTVPLYHAYKVSDIDNFYTVSLTEKNNAVANSGYQDKGITGYVLPNDIAPPSYPDLAVLNVAASPNPSCNGQQVNVNFNIKNTGSAAVSNAQVAVYLGSSQVATHLVSLAAGASVTKTYSYTADASAKTIKIVADYNNAIAESNETNNQGIITVSSGSCATLPLKGRIIMLDPGHMPSEADRIKSGEYYATHNISRVLKPLLESLGAQVNETPATYDLTQRVNYANKINTDLLVSIHFNAGNDTDTVTNGLESFYGTVNSTGQTGGVGGPEQDKIVCKNIVPEVQKIINSTLRGDKGIKPDTQTLYGYSPPVRYTIMPACLVEMEYITTIRNVSLNGKTYTSHKSLFLSADYTNAAANALKNGIVNYFNNTVTIAIVPNSTSTTNTSGRVGWLSTGELYIPEGVLTGYCYVNSNRIPCSMVGKDVRISGAFDWYAAKYKYYPQAETGCGRSEASFQNAFNAATPENRNKGFSMFYNQSGTLYWLEVNASHPDILKDGTYQIMPILNIQSSQAVCKSVNATPPVANTTNVSNRVGWLSTGELYIPKGVLTGHCYSNNLRILNCPVLGKDVRISGSFDWYAEQVKYFSQTASLCGKSEPGFKQKYLSASQEYQNKGFSLVYYVNGTAYWLEVNASHPDILTDGTYQIRPTLDISSAACS